MADDTEVNIVFGASIEDVVAKVRELGELFRGIGDGVKAELSDRAGGFMDSLKGKTTELGKTIEGELRGRAAAAFGVFGRDAQSVAEMVNSKWDEIPGPLKNVGIALLGVGAIIAAGLGAKKLADDNAEMIESTRDFARALGVTTNEASVYQAALADIGSSQGEFETATKGLQRQLKTNEEGMNKLGLVTRDAAGNLRPLNDLTLDAIKVLGDYKEGTDRNAVAQVILGRGVAASSRLMLLNKEVVDENRKAVEELGLEVGENAVEGFKDYDAASDRASLTLKAFGKAIQESVLPVATELTEWFNNLAPAGITVLRGALAGLSTAFVVVTNGVAVLWQVLGAMIDTVTGPLTNLGGALNKVLTGDFAGASAAFQAIGSNFSGIWSKALDNIAESSQKTRDRVGRMWAFTDGPDSKAGDSGSPGGTKTAPDFKGDKEAEKAAEKAAKEAARRAAAAAKEEAREREKAAEAGYKVAKAQAEQALAIQKEDLKAEEAANAEAYKNNLVTVEQFYAEKLRIELAGISASRAAKLEELADANQRAADADKDSERLKFQAAAIKLQGEIVVLTRQESEAVRANTAARIDAERQLGNQLAELRASSEKASAEAEIETERGLIEQKRALGLIDNEQTFQAQLDLEARSYAATQQYLARKRFLLQDGDQVGQESQRAAEIAANEQHQARITAINRAAVLDRARDSIQAQGQIQGNFATMIQSLLNGTQTIGNAFRSFALSVANTFTNLIAQRFTERLFNATGANAMIDKIVNFFTEGGIKMLAQWIATQIGMTSATAAGAATRTGIEAGAAATSKAITAETTIASIGAKAWDAAAGVYASIAAIPFVGPFLAPAMAIAAGAAVLGFASRIASSAGGEYRVSQDRLNFVHKDETILPARFASGLRELIDGGGPRAAAVGPSMPTALPANPLGRIQAGGGTGTGEGAAIQRGGGGGAPVVQLVGASAGDFFIANRKHLLKVLSDAGRDGAR